MSKKENKQVKVISKVINNYAAPLLQVVIALMAIVVLLGLAAKGAAQYLSAINGQEKTIASIVVVVLLAYAICVGLKRVLK